MCGEPRRRARRADAHPRRLGRATPRPRRPRVRRSSRPHRGHAARHQPRARAEAAAELAGEIRNEFVLQARGEVVARSPETVNPRMPTGEVELAVDELEIVSRSTPLPFQLDEENVDETLRLRYRWLDLRREKLQRNLRLRAQMVGIIRRHMEAAGFLDIQTPILYKSTPEGARDFVVPSRLHKGALLRAPAEPADPQAADDDRRLRPLLPDRDLLPGRGSPRRSRPGAHPARRRDELPRPGGALRSRWSRCSRAIWRDCLGVEIETPWPRMTYEEADRRFGSDKPDTRFGARARGRDRAHARVGVRRLRRRRGRPLPPRAEDVLARRARRPRGAREGARREGPGVPDPRRGERRDSLADRQVPLRAELEALAPAPGETLLFVADDMGDDVARPRAPSPPPRSRARADRRRALHVPLGDRLPDVRAGTTRRIAGARCITRSRGRPTSGRRPFRRRARAGARARLRHHRQRERARRRVVPDPRAGHPGAGLRPARADARRSSARSSASCSTRWRWARRRTVASRSGSTG